MADIYGERRKAISFNLNNPDERMMYEFVNKTNFSRLVKRLLAQEIRRIRNTTQQSVSSQSITLHSEKTIKNPSRIDGQIMPK